MAAELSEIAYGSYEHCERCGISDISQPGWDCVCDLLLEAGNCPGCMNIPEKCVCIHITTTIEDETSIVATD